MRKSLRDHKQSITGRKTVKRKNISKHISFPCFVKFTNGHWLTNINTQMLLDIQDKSDGLL